MKSLSPESEPIALTSQLEDIYDEYQEGQIAAQTALTPEIRSFVFNEVVSRWIRRMGEVAHLNDLKLELMAAYALRDNRAEFMRTLSKYGLAYSHGIDLIEQGHDRINNILHRAGYERLERRKFHP